MRIGNVEFENNLFLAPMCGFGEFAFRSICKEFGAGGTVSEMVSAKGLCYGSKNTEEMLLTLENENPKIVQLFGSEPEFLAKACASECLKKFDVIDLNMGCPAPKIYNNFEGSNLMANMPLAKEIICACVNATDKPITVKFRMGIDEEHVNAVEFAKMCEEAGASAITIHGRTRNQFYSGVVDYGIITAVKNAVKIPVIGNGDVVDVESFEKMLATGCDGVMIGRGAVGNPEIFSILQQKQIDVDRKKLMIHHINLLCEKVDEKKAVLHFRKHLAKYLKKFEVNAEKRLEILAATTKDELLSLVKTLKEKR